MPNKREIIKKKKGEVIHEAKISSINDLEEKKRGFQKGKIIVIVSISILVLILIGAFFGLNEKKTTMNFKKEYESLNGQTDRNGNKYQNLSIDSDNVIQYANYKKIFNILEQGTGILLFCAPESLECRNIVPILLDTADEVGADTIYYLNPSSDREQKEKNKEGKIITTKKGTKEYNQLLEKLDSILNFYEELDDPSIKRVYFPTIIFVKEGEIISSYLENTDQQEEKNLELSKAQIDMLKAEFMDKMSQIITCDETC